MKYRENIKNNEQLSILGFGCMRFLKDERETEKQIIYAIENGINYFDTAYTYPNSEKVLGRILAKGYRDKVKIATKMPHFLIKNYSDFDRIFNEQLRRLQTNYIDYYLMHVLTDVCIWQRLVDLGLLKWLCAKKNAGQIVNFGFSYHGGKEEFVKLIDAYDWDFCMIQYNYFDENNQAGRSGLEYAFKKKIPVMVMEPLRGGSLVNNLPKEVDKEFSKVNPNRTAAEWGLRWVWNHPPVLLLLSGMNSLAMIEENVEIAGDVNQEFSDEELKMFERVKKIMHEKIKIPCTGCNYCMPCPFGVDIPTCFACYNDIFLDGKMAAFKRYLMQTSLRKKATNASLCTKCGRCEERCPQKIEIRKSLDLVVNKLESFYYKPVRFFLKKFIKF